MPIVKINRRFHKVDPGKPRKALSGQDPSSECAPLQTRFSPMPFNIISGEGLRKAQLYSRFKENGH
jgi:hypothetical protein